MMVINEVGQVWTPHPPQLRYDELLGRFVMGLPGNSDYAVAIGHWWDGERWDHYNFLHYADDGEMFEVVTAEQYRRLVQDVVDHEGDEIAAVWAESQETYEVVRDDHPVFALAERWQAILTLGLFIPATTFRRWQSKPLPPEVAAELNDLRDAQMRATAEEMAAAMGAAATTDEVADLVKLLDECDPERDAVGQMTGRNV